MSRGNPNHNPREFWRRPHPWLHRHEFLQFEELRPIRGTQPLCLSCVKACKVLDAPNSRFICYDYEREKAS